MNQVELLAPVGDFECLKAAVSNGADSVYFGGSFFNARSSAKNFEGETLKQAIRYAKTRNVKTHLTLNTLIKNQEFEDAIALASEAYHYGIDAIIVQDVGLAMELKKRFPDLPLHASTQMSAHNLEGVLQLEKMGFERVVLSRELSINEIEYICKNSSVEIEVFIHGALCISYSGQCLFSSTIGGRSGNRGKCAQPCRLPYTLYENEKNINKGYLLSTRDLMGIDYLPRLIKAGVSCFKIEGRMKPPEYVATVTRVYRKYIDRALAGKDVTLEKKDKTDLLQVFNRGSFSTGHLSSDANHKLIFPDKPNNMGIYIGNISRLHPSKGLVTLELNEPLAIGDTVSFEKENSKYTISELMHQNKNITEATSKMRVTIGRMKGNLSIGDKVYKMASKELLQKAKNSYSLSEEKKFPLVCQIFIHNGKPVTMHISPATPNTLYGNFSLDMCSAIYPEEALKTPLTQERVIAQISKTNSTPYYFKQIEVDLEEGVHIPSIAGLNELRRSLLAQYEETFATNILRPISTHPVSHTHAKSVAQLSAPKVAVLLSEMDEGKSYSHLEHVDYLYIPLANFLNPNLHATLLELTNQFRVYVQLPTILKANFRNVILTHLEKLLQTYSIQGFVISNIADIELLKQYRNEYNLVGNFTLNVFNTHSLEEWKALGVRRVTISPELNKQECIHLCANSPIETELMVYGNYPIMHLGYCLLGKANHCYPTCDMKCKHGSKFYLEDRLGFRFRIVPDNLQTVTKVYNSKIPSISADSIACSVMRITAHEESIEELNEIIAFAKQGKRLEGKNYTNGNFTREV